MKFDFPDVADFPENIEARNDDDCSELHLLECVTDFLGWHPSILTHQLNRIAEARAMYSRMQREPQGIYSLKADTARLQRAFAADIDKVTEIVPGNHVKAIDRAKVRKDAEAIELVQNFLNVPWRVKDLTIHVSKPGDKHHYQQFRDCETVTKLLNLHVDPKPGIMKAIIYLSDVGEDDGPFQAIESKDWEYDELQRIYAWGNSVGNYCHTREHRRVANAFPSRYRRNAIIGRLISDESELSDWFLSNLVTYTSDIANVIVFDPCFNFHRGGICKAGTRVNLQVRLQ